MFFFTFCVFDILFHLWNPTDLCAKSSEFGIEAENRWISEEGTEGPESVEYNEAESEWADRTGRKYKIKKLLSKRW